LLPGFFTPPSKTIPNLFVHTFLEQGIRYRQSNA